MDPTHDTLKAYQREHRESFNPALSLRTHRALSWLGRAEREGDDPDARFVFLWIAFNAAYAQEVPDRAGFSERRVLLEFLSRLIELDRERSLHRIVWEQFPGPIRLLIDNKFVYQPFWAYCNGDLDDATWRAAFARSRASAHRALGGSDTRRVLAIVFDRLYVLRNQLVHGGATWNSSVNRHQVRDGAAIMGRLVPAVIEIMMRGGGEVWGEPRYPVVD